MVFRFDAIGFILGLCDGAAELDDPLCRRQTVEFRAGADDLVHRYRARQHRLSIHRRFRSRICPQGRFFATSTCGAIAAAGIFGIAKSLRIVAGAIGIALRVFRKSDVVTSPDRVDRDISTTTIFVGVQVAAVSVGIYLGENAGDEDGHSD